MSFPGFANKGTQVTEVKGRLLIFFSVLNRDDFDSERIILESENQPIAAICLDLTIKATLEEILNDIQ